MANPVLNPGPIDGQRIGLFGGSFNPPHPGHVAVSESALRRLDLDWVWWLVSPLNPLKDPSEISDFAERLAAARALVTHPRIVVSDLEKRIGTRTTAQLLDAMAPMLRRAHFVWIMGADSFAGLHKWNEWREIPAHLPLAVLDRPGFAQAALTSPAARTLARWRVNEADAASLPMRPPPAWVFLRQRHRQESSTAIRRSRQTGSNPPPARSVGEGVSQDG
jgi:nicotinate-nucleotide adenylyltransferase